MKSLLSLIYRFGVWLRNQLYDKGICQSYTTDIPTICVGNLAVGGTGKTPMAEYLLRLLSVRYKVAYLSRGYKRRTKGFVLADDNADALTIGDEAMQIHRKFPDILVAVDEDRLHGIEMLRRHAGSLQVVVLDDALQHRKLRAGMNILLTRCNNLYINDRFLPAGRLRDHVSSALRAKMIVVTDCKPNLAPIEKRIIETSLHITPYQELFFTSVRYGTLRPLFPEQAHAEPPANSDNAAVLAAIADPEPMMQHIKTLYPSARLFSFADHHQFTKKDIELLKYRSLIITSEKDAERLLAMDLPEQTKAKIYVLPIEIYFQSSQEQQFNKKVIAYVTENNRNR